MAYIEENVRADGGTSCVVRWRLGGSRTGRRQSETFGQQVGTQSKYATDQQADDRASENRHELMVPVIGRPEPP